LFNSLIKSIFNANIKTNKMKKVTIKIEDIENGPISTVTVEVNNDNSKEKVYSFIEDHIGGRPTDRK